MNNKYYKIFGHTYIYIKDKLPEDISVKNMAQYIQKTLPMYHFSDLDNIFIGSFEELEQRQVNSVFLNNTIYATNKQSCEMDLIDDIVHEIGHSVEQNYMSDIHTNASLVYEFISKRNELFNKLSQVYDVEQYKKLFLSTEFSETLDKLFYDTIGYSNLGVLTEDIFLSPYAATSLSEYFANGFEHYYLSNNTNTIKTLSPVLYSVLTEIHKEALNS